MKPRAVKEQDLAVLRQEFSTARSAFVVEFVGLKVVDVDDLRRKVRQAKGSYRVVRNRLAKKASEGTVLAGVAEHFRGPTAVVLANEEPSSVAKALSDFSAANKAVSIKVGVVEGSTLSAAACKELGNLPSREVLLGRLANVLNSPLQRLATVLAAPSRNLAVVLDQVAKKQSGE